MLKLLAMPQSTSVEAKIKLKVDFEIKLHYIVSIMILKLILDILKTFQLIAWWSLEIRIVDTASRLQIKPKFKSDLKALNLKSYHEYHIWGFQKTKN